MEDPGIPLTGAATSPGPLAVLPEHTCYELLASKRAGWLVVIVADEPDAFTVNYVLVDRTIIVRTGYGLKYLQSRLQRVAFLVDELDETRHEGWSVVVRGVADEVTDDYAASTLPVRDALLTPWAEGSRERWIRIIPRVVTGRTVHATPR